MLVKEFNSMGLKVQIYKNRIEYKQGLKTITILIKTIQTIEVPPLLAAVDITAGGKRYRIPISLNDREDFKNTLYELL